MKGIRKLDFIIIFFLIVTLFVINAILLCVNTQKDREYRVEIERICQIIEEGENVDKKELKYIISIYNSKVPSEEFLEGGSSDYVIRKINGEFYRIEYALKNFISDSIIVMINIIVILFGAAVIIILIYIDRNIIIPFKKMQSYPYELSKGNLTIPLKELKGRYFGKFIWGLDLLREKLEKQKSEELKLQKEKKTLILSISHDIKTPLSAIKLYSKALLKNLYTEREKQFEVIEKIDEKADEIEKLMAQLIKASNEDFISLEVKISEFYLSEIIDEIIKYYSDKLSLNKINFTVSKYSNCILKGDAPRAVEVLQNIIENALKYGDGEYISISFLEEEDCCLITIQNSGCAILENEIPHIFDSFWRGSNAKGENGSGLG